MPKTIIEKIIESHTVHKNSDSRQLLYIDFHLIHEVTSPQAFEGLKLAGRKLRRPNLCLATIDHTVPTIDRDKPWKDSKARIQREALEQNVKEFGVTYFGLDDRRQGIVHITGPEQGLSRPGMTIVCGDSHTATHGAFGALAFGIGTSEVEHVMATSTLSQGSIKTININIENTLSTGVSAKDLILHIIGQTGAAGCAGYVAEYTGSGITSLSMEGRMTVCNMSIEMGARAGLVGPDNTTFEYLKGRPFAPSNDDFQNAVVYWTSFKTDKGAKYNKQISFDAVGISPRITWGTSPDQSIAVGEKVPTTDSAKDEATQKQYSKALDYMELNSGTDMCDVPVDVVFLGSCTNGRIEDLRAAAKIVRGQKIAEGVEALVVPGSQMVKKMAEKEGLDRIFLEAGFSFRDPGCSMCLAMNPDVLGKGKRCASTSNRNFEGRQGPGGRTHLVSPQMAAAAAIHGHFIDVREIL